MSTRTRKSASTSVTTYNNLMSQLVSQLQEELKLETFLSQLTKELDVELTPGARLILLVPLIEVRDKFGVRPFAESSFSSPSLQAPSLDGISEKAALAKLIGEATLSPTLHDTEAAPDSTNVQAQSQITRSSLSMLRAFWKNFCDIPPFCDKTGR